MIGITIMVRANIPHIIVEPQQLEYGLGDIYSYKKEPSKIV